MTLEFVPESSTSYTLSEIVYYLGIAYLCSIFLARLKINTPMRLKKSILKYPQTKLLEVWIWRNYLSEYLRHVKYLGISTEGYQYYINLLKRV